MLLTRSRSTGLEVCATGSRYWPLPSPRSILRSFGAGWAFSGRGWVGVHSTNFSPMSDCGRIVHSASRRKSSKPGRSMRSTTAALWSGVTSSDSILPTLTPGDLHVLARDDREGVHEDRAHAVVRRRRRSAPVPKRPARRRRASTRGDGEEALHGPGSTRLGSQSSEPSASRNGRRAVRRRLRGRARAAPDLAGLQAGQALARRDRRQRAARRVVGERVGVEDRLDAREVAVGVVVRRAHAEVAQPADEVGRVGPDELDAPAWPSAAPRSSARTTAWRPARARGALPQQVGEVVVRAAAVDERAQVGDRRARVAARAGAARRRKRREVLRRRLGRGDEHVEVVERRAQVDERRVGLAQRAGQQRRAPG